MRPAFLLLPPTSVLLGLATARQSGASWQPGALLLILTGALFAHAAVNLLNEYSDFHSGLDHQTRRTPFSGGSGALLDSPQHASLVRNAGLLLLALTSAIGLYFSLQLGPDLIPLGLLGLLVIVSYTPWLNRNPWLCLMAPGLGFGPLMVMGTHFVLTKQYSTSAFLVSLIPFFLCNNLLLLNQYPDIEADRSVGRRHFPIAYGLESSHNAYGIMMLLCYLVIFLAVIDGKLPLLALLALLPGAAAFAAWRGASRYAEEPDRLVPYLGLNVASTLLTPALLGTAMLLSGRA